MLIQLDITINYKNATDLNKNATFTTIYKNGKFLYTIDVNGTTTKELLFTIFNKKTNLRSENDTVDPEYIIQYKTSQNPILHYSLEGNLTLTKTNKILKGQFNSVKDGKNAIHANTLYTISLFAYNKEKDKDITKYNKLQLTEIPIKTSLVKGTDAAITNFEIGDLDTNSEFIVTVQANAMKGEASELLVYPPGTTITTIVPENKKNNTWKYVIIGDSIVLVALLLAGLFLWKKGRKHGGNGTLEKEYKKIKELDNQELTY